MRCLIVVLLLPIYGFAQQTAYQPDRRFTPEQLRQDFQVLQTALEQLHPGLYRYTPRDSMALAYRQTLTRLDQSMTDVQFGLVVRPYLGLVRCVHTYLAASRSRTRYVKKQKYAPFPLSLTYNQERLYVAAAPEKHPNVRAFDELVAVDGRPVAELMAQFETQNWVDGYVTTARRALTASRFGQWHQAFYGYRDSLTVELADSLGNRRAETLVFSRKSVKKDARRAQADSSRRQERILQAPPLLKKNNLSLTLAHGDSTLAVLRIDGFNGGANPRQFRRAFALLQQRNVQHLAIDVRGNFGGSAVTCRDLLRYLSDRPFRFWDSTIVKRRNVRPVPARVNYGGPLSWLELKLRIRREANGLLQLPTYRRVVKPYAKRRFDGPVYVLMSSLSLSAAAVFPALAKTLNPRVTLVGYETGGGGVSCNAGHTFRVKLPNTNYVAAIPYYHIRWNRDQPDRGRGVQPDVPVQSQVANLRRGQDLDLDEVKRLIKTRRANRLSTQR